MCVVHRWRSPVHSPYKGLRHGALMFTLMWTWANCWTNIGGASDWDDIMFIWRHCSMHTNCCSVLETLTWFFLLTWQYIYIYVFISTFTDEHTCISSHIITVKLWIHDKTTQIGTYIQFVSVCSIPWDHTSFFSLVYHPGPSSKMSYMRCLLSYKFQTKFKIALYIGFHSET